MCASPCRSFRDELARSARIAEILAALLKEWPPMDAGDVRKVGSMFTLYRKEALAEAKQRALTLPPDARDARALCLRQLEKLGPFRPLLAPPHPEAVDDLRGRFPNFREVADFLAEMFAVARLASAPVAALPPILLLGPGGVGKTAFSFALAKVMQVPYQAISLGGVSSGFVLAGLDVGYSTGKPGRVFETLATCCCGNPLVLLDEIDKASDDSRYPVTSILYTLLEGQTASAFTDEAAGIAVDASAVQWIATANYQDAIEPALLSRFQVFEVPSPDREQTRQIARNVYGDLLSASGWGEHFRPYPDDSVIDLLVGLPPRALRQVLRRALGRAALVKRDHLLPSDLPKLAAARPALGFQ